MSAPLNWHKWLVLSLLGLALSARTIGCDYSSITEKFGAEAVARCNEKCPFQNRTGDGHFDVSCGSDCSVQQCKLGCSLWQEGLENSCQIVCNVTSETVFSRELYCVMGCNEALNTYFQKLRELIGIPTAPALVADSLTATSLSLVWEAPNLGNLSYMVQWRYEELPGTWQYYSNSSHSDQSIIHVDGLRPYTKYRFRVAIFLSGRGGNGEPVYSAPSVVISTLENGKPSSAPSSLRAVAPDPSRVAISWEPGPFPNGPLISYVLRLTDTQPNTNDAVEDMPASNYTLFYMFQNLNPAREYEVSVAMRNSVGEGPRAYVRISTPPLPTSVPSQQPILILGGEQNVLAAPANDMLSDPVELYSTEYSITGVGLDISSDSLFTSVSNGYVYRSSLSKKSTSEAILTPENYKPQDLSVDWLNRHLYVLGEVHYRRADFSNVTFITNWEILRCDFDGKNLIVALSGFNSRPIHFEVDAYNGYLFWAQQGGDRGGLYRLDLANISNGVRHDGPPEMIVRDAHLGAFTVDHADFRILVAHLRRNTVLAVSLDGREVADFRANTQTPMFLSTRSIAYAGGLFYWTNGKEMLTEEYHEQSNSYFHNEYPLAYNTKTIATRQVLVALRSCQPIPVPVNPPLGLQSVMGINRAKVSWSPPHLLGHQGSGAWQQWLFHLQLTHVETGDVIDIMNITESTCIVENLKQGAEYVIRVAAVTESGSGPWSSEFVGKTLASSPNTLHSTLLWSGPDGLLQTDLTGDNLQILIHGADLKNFQITDISWYRDKLYLVTNVSTVMWYNTTTHEKGFMPSMDNVGSLAVDWVGKKIYWSNPKQQLITRGNLDGSNREPVPIVTVAKELTIDSLGAYIYWNTGHAVEAARLNGENKMIYYPAQLFSGKQVMGLTADLEEKWLYWLVRSYDGSELHRAPTADQITHGVSEISGSLVTRLSGSATLGPLCYFSGRLVWVQDASRAVVSDLAGRYTAELVPRVHVIAVRDPTLHADSESLIAIPETINSSSIAVAGEWDRFNVTWDPATRVNVNNSRVYYDVNLHFPGQYKIERTVEVSWVEVVSVSVAPYSSMEATVRAHTHWGGGPAARARLRSPQAQPSAPRAPRIYVQPARSGGPQSAIFRWGSPARANGVIRGYEAQCWVVGADSTSPTKPSACADAHLSPSHTQLMLRDLTPASKYFFQVRAHTDAGFGQYSEVVSTSSDEVNPIPKVMVSSQESIKIIDLDSGESETIPKSTGIPVDFAVSTEENIVYWVNNLEEIFSSRINGSGHFKLTSINGSATSMCVDWVGRSVYWTQLEITSIESYVTYRADLGMPNTRPHITRVFARKQPIFSLQIAPLHQSLFWYEESDTRFPELGTIMTSHLNGSDIKRFFRNPEASGRDCNCPENPQVARPFVIDMTRNKNYDLYWVDPWVHHIIATDMDACKCRIVVDATEKKKYGFTPRSITVDSRYVYWFNSTQKEIFYTTKHHKTRIEERKTAYGYKIMALDPGNQPYPTRLCLFPKVLHLRPRVLSNSANSITLHMPSVEKPNRCHSLQYEMSTTEYTIFYRVQMKNDTSLCDKESCPYVTTTNTEVMINELKPFTNYTVMLEATNYYAKLHEVKPLVGTPMTIQTAAEAPLAPKDVTGMVLSPVLAHVEWKPALGLSYEVHWTTDDSPHKLKEHNTFEVSQDRSANITRLTPNTAYTVWVRARSKHSAVSADSAPLRLRTYPLPPPLATKEVTPYEIRVLWPPPTSYQLHQFKVEYTEATPSSATWKACTQDERNEWLATELRPRTRYRFRLRLQYVSKAPPYYWPHDDRFTFETLGDVPGPPGPLRVEGVGDRVLRVWWTEPDTRGSAIIAYRVWGRPQHRIAQGNDNITKNLSELLPANLPSDIDDKMKMRIAREGLELLHNGTETYWLLSGGGAEGGVGAGWLARVQARNAHGWGPLSAPAELDAAALARARPPAAALALALLAALAALLAVAAAVFYGMFTLCYIYVLSRTLPPAELDAAALARARPPAAALALALLAALAALLAVAAAVFYGMFTLCYVYVLSRTLPPAELDAAALARARPPAAALALALLAALAALLAVAAAVFYGMFTLCYVYVLSRTLPPAELDAAALARARPPAAALALALLAALAALLAVAAAVFYGMFTLCYVYVLSRTLPPAELDAAALARARPPAAALALALLAALAALLAVAAAVFYGMFTLCYVYVLSRTLPPAELDAAALARARPPAAALALALLAALAALLAVAAAVFYGMFTLCYVYVLSRTLPPAELDAAALARARPPAAALALALLAALAALLAVAAAVFYGMFTLCYIYVLSRTLPPAELDAAALARARPPAAALALALLAALAALLAVAAAVFYGMFTLCYIYVLSRTLPPAELDAAALARARPPAAALALALLAALAALLAVAAAVFYGMFTLCYIYVLSRTLPPAELDAAALARARPPAAALALALLAALAALLAVAAAVFYGMFTLCYIYVLSRTLPPAELDAAALARARPPAAALALALLAALAALLAVAAAVFYGMFTLCYIYVLSRTLPPAELDAAALARARPPAAALALALLAALAALLAVAAAVFYGMFTLCYIYVLSRTLPPAELDAAALARARPPAAALALALLAALAALLAVAAAVFYGMFTLCYIYVLSRTLPPAELDAAALARARPPAAALALALLAALAALLAVAAAVFYGMFTLCYIYVLSRTLPPAELDAAALARARPSAAALALALLAALAALLAVAAAVFYGMFTLCYIYVLSRTLPPAELDAAALARARPPAAALALALLAALAALLAVAAAVFYGMFTLCYIYVLSRTLPPAELDAAALARARPPAAALALALLAALAALLAVAAAVFYGMFTLCYIYVLSRTLPPAELDAAALARARPPAAALALALLAALAALLAVAAAVFYGMFTLCYVYVLSRTLPPAELDAAALARARPPAAALALALLAALAALLAVAAAVFYGMFTLCYVYVLSRTLPPAELDAAALARARPPAAALALALLAALAALLAVAAAVFYGMFTLCYVYVLSRTLPPAELDAAALARARPPAAALALALLAALAALLAVAAAVFYGMFTLCYVYVLSRTLPPAELDAAALARARPPAAALALALLAALAALLAVAAAVFYGMFTLCYVYVLSRTLPPAELDAAALARARPPAAALALALLAALAALLAVAAAVFYGMFTLCYVYVLSRTLPPAELDAAALARARPPAAALALALLAALAALLAVAAAVFYGMFTLCYVYVLSRTLPPAELDAAALARARPPAAALALALLAALAALLAVAAAVFYGMFTLCYVYVLSRTLPPAELDAAALARARPPAAALALALLAALAALLAVAAAVFYGMFTLCYVYVLSRTLPPAELDAAALARARPPAAALALALLAALAALLAVAAAVFYAAYNARARKKAAIENQISTNPARRGPDVELATLRQLPTRHSTNILYNQGVHCPTDAELASLPHIRREQITLTKFLGSGAFGEVFEGVARQINGSTADTKVAVKTLRKSATEQEKTEFLKEAALMSNFKHEHILRLLGVCLDNDPNYIIMELMEGGDLLSYLRAKRVSLYTPESLTLLDLLNMCVDVTKGCRYLEEMHFVHRDLACRNCLVAHRANGRVVKIGDFGLARDIYKNDYYRKEGEGLLPVRWMAVECLVDGVFSCQSDVWAWGVLCWEVLSLGQQPYPARTNRQVLSYVRTGGTLDRPPNCPSAFYDLLQKCWSYSAEARPSFRQCLEVVRALRDKTSPNITLTATPTPAPHYLTLLGDDAVDNRTYLLDENENACLDEDFPEHHMEPSRLLPERTPKYLELMYDSDSAPGTICDGYEIPRAPITYMPPFSRHSIVGVAPNRLIKPPLYRTHSLRTHTRPPNATIIPLRNGLVKRASLCEEISAREPRPCSSREQPCVDLDFDKHVFKTPF